ncbi:hypothetical protein ACMFMG_005958 [Clarireedia jacksonii]
MANDLSTSFLEMKKSLLNHSALKFASRMYEAEEKVRRSASNPTNTKEREIESLLRERRAAVSLIQLENSSEAAYITCLENMLRELPTTLDDDLSKIYKKFLKTQAIVGMIEETAKSVESRASEIRNQGLRIREEQTLDSLREKEVNEKLLELGVTEELKYQKD